MRSNIIPTPCYENPCGSYHVGHHVHFIQARLGWTEPQYWADVLVDAVDGHWITVRHFDSGVFVARAWHHEELIGIVVPDEPVRIHLRYDMLGLGTQRKSLFIAEIAPEFMPQVRRG